MKLIQLNIERRFHLGKVLPFLKKENPDIICLQELMEIDIALLEKELNKELFFLPLINIPLDEDPTKKADEGIAILTSLPVKSLVKDFYFKSKEGEKEPGGYPEMDRGIVAIEVEKDNKHFFIATTHFTWTPDGRVDKRQKRDVKALLEVLSLFPELIITGDFNAPRPGKRKGEIYLELCKHFKDNIPKEYTSSLDPELHRAGHLQYVVDYVWSTPKYKVTNVKLAEGVSDHKAIMCTIQ